MDLYIELYIKGGAGSTYGYNNSGAAPDIAGRWKFHAKLHGAGSTIGI